MKPDFFSKEWADAVRDALAAGPPEQARAGKLQEYWDFFELIKGMYPASWALGCRDLLRSCPAYLFVQWGGGTVTDCQIIAPDAPPRATYVLGMDYLDWKALHEGYDAQRTVMYRKMMLEDGNLLEFFKGIYFFVESLAVIGTVPAAYPVTRRARPGGGPSGGLSSGPKARSTCSPRTSGCHGPVPTIRMTGSGLLYSETS